LKEQPPEVLVEQTFALSFVELFDLEVEALHVLFIMFRREQ
jgi:hypothetical protein